MLMPSIFGENLFDDWMDFRLRETFSVGKTHCMESTQRI